MLCVRVVSKATVINLKLQCLHLSRQHVVEVFAEEDTCLLTDETSKKGGKYTGTKEVTALASCVFWNPCS